MSKVVVTFQPENAAVEVDRGENLLQAALSAGVHIDAACGGAGTCGRCKVRIKMGMTSPVEGGGDEAADGMRLACRCAAMTDVTVEVAGQARIDRAVLGTGTVRSNSRVKSIPEGDIAGEADLGTPPFSKHRVVLTPPTMQDNASDIARLMRGLREQHGLANVTVDPFALGEVAAALRDGDWTATATVALVSAETLGVVNPDSGAAPCQFGRKLTRIEPGDTTARHCVLALDIGTTTVWGQVVDLAARRVLATASDYNGQISYGEDVITRIVAAGKPGGMAALQGAVVKTINGVMAELLAKSGVPSSAISSVTVAGNTTMTHLLLGLPPRHIREAPYVLTTNFFPFVRAHRLGLNLPEQVRLFAFPAISSYVGGDIVAGVLAAGFHRKKELTLYMDLGTNGELVVGNAEWMVTTSCSAGPALEGGGVRCGVRAIPGAVEDFSLHPVTGRPMIVTMGGAKAIGVCGVGLIGMIGDLFLKGIIEPNGKFNSGSTQGRAEAGGGRACAGSGRLREGADGSEFVIVEAANSGTGSDIVLTEPDIENIIRAKAAMYAGVQTLLDAVNLSIQDIDRVIIAGALGNWLDLDKAIFIGIFPDVPRDKFAYLGNGSLRGARLASLSSRMLEEAEGIARMMTNIELSDNHRFTENYLSAMFLPHTDLDRFPSVKARLAGGRKVALRVVS